MPPMESGSFVHTRSARLLPSCCRHGLAGASPSLVMNWLYKVDQGIFTGVASLSHWNPWQVDFHLPLALTDFRFRVLRGRSRLDELGCGDSSVRLVSYF